MEENPSNGLVTVIPVCGMTVKPGAQAIRSTHQARTYLFCADACRAAFDSDSAKYLSATTPRRNGWWLRYLQRVRKATDGKSLNCH